MVTHILPSFGFPSGRKEVKLFILYRQESLQMQHHNPTNFIREIHNLQYRGRRLPDWEAVEYIAPGP